MPPKKKARKVRHVNEVIALEHSHRQCQERERSVTPDGGEIDEVVVANRIYARIARAVQGGECRREGCTLGTSISKTLQLLMGSLILRALKCTNAEKVMYATYALQGPTKR